MNENINFLISEHEENIQKIINDGKKYIENNIPNKTPISNIIIQQCKYISPVLWILQIFGIISAVILFNIQTSNIENIKKILYFISPFISILTVPEIMKNYFFGIYEIESSCKNSIAKIFIIRLILNGFINVFSLFILIGVASLKFKQEFLDLIISAFLPFNFINIMILFLVNILKIKNHYICLICSLISFSFVIIAVPNIILKNINTIISVLLLIFTTLILYIQIIKKVKTIKRKDIMGYEFNFN